MLRVTLPPPDQEGQRGTSRATKDDPVRCNNAIPVRRLSCSECDTIPFTFGGSASALALDRLRGSAAILADVKPNGGRIVNALAAQVARQEMRDSLVVGVHSLNPLRGLRRIGPNIPAVDLLEKPAIFGSFWRLGIGGLILRNPALAEPFAVGDKNRMPR